MDHPIMPNRLDQIDKKINKDYEPDKLRDHCSAFFLPSLLCKFRLENKDESLTRLITFTFLTKILYLMSIKFHFPSRILSAWHVDLAQL